MRKILPLLILALATACSPKVRTQLIDNKSIIPTNNITKVTVLDINDVVPTFAKKLGNVRVYDGGLTINCDWKTVLGKAEIEALSAGGNLLKITKHTLPGIMSSCHQIDADIYFVESLEPKPQISTVQSDADSIPRETAQVAEIPMAMPFQRYRVSFNGGFSYLIGKTSESVPNDLKNYISELKSGSHFSVDGGYFWKENIGLGLKYSSFLTKNSIDNVTVTDVNGQTRNGRLADNINTQFFGATIYNRAYSKSRNTVWLLNASLGYLAYKDNATVINNFLITGGTLGGGLDFSADFKLGENFYFGLGAGYMLGVLKQVKYGSGSNQQIRKFDEGEYESMNRIDLSAGVRWAW